MKFFKKIFNSSPQPKVEVAFAWGKEVDGMDDLSAIEFATLQFNADFKKDVFKDEQNLEALFVIDEKIHIIVERITSHYINIEHLSMDMEERIANSVFLYHRQIYLIYNTLIDNLAPLQPQSLTVMLARAMKNATQMIKWRFYNYQSAPANVWLQLSKLYLVAEKQILLEEYVRPYPEQEITTLASAYIQACMLGSLESLSFQRKQIELVSQMLARWTPDIHIQSSYDENKHQFYMDTLSDVAAKHIRDSKPLPSYRYWCFDSVNLKIELGLSLIEYKIVPKQQEMKDIISNQYAALTLEVIKNEWSRSEFKRQRRSVERVKTSKYAITTYGFEDTCYDIRQNESLRIQRRGKSYQGNKSFDELFALQSLSPNLNNPEVIYLDLGETSSKVIDESPKGFGMYIKKLASEVSLGMLIGVTLSDQKDTTYIGLIRSIKNIVGNELHIGIELLSTNAVCLVAHNVSADASNAKSSDENSLVAIKPIELNKQENFNSVVSDAGFTCLYLPREFTTPQHDSMQLESLIIPKLHYNKNDTYKINISGTEILVKFTEALEHHENWLRVIYTQVIERKMAA
ncbi:MAG: hypothetical protein PSV17_01545 [Methylotenera sp.]|uniref:hypothetical protein n=1 Tax=Methylotenera sp. TaxID=2051956 RepID=UPI002488D9C8|nr:hypothetical protein [Methylotenera sp.]MDI1308103.1 hypothetical protein [Methylotenera sp.]